MDIHLRHERNKDTDGLHSDQKQVEELVTFASIESDHRVLAAKLKLSLRTAKKTPRGNVYKWRMFTSNKNLHEDE